MKSCNFSGSDICLRETLAEFHIPHKDLTFGKKSDDIVSIGRRAHIYKYALYISTLTLSYCSQFSMDIGQVFSLTSSFSEATGMGR